MKTRTPTRELAAIVLMLAAFSCRPAKSQVVRDDAPAGVEDQGAGTVTETRTVLGSQTPEAAHAAAAAGTRTPGAIPPTNAAPASPHSLEAERQYLKGANALDERDVRGAVKYLRRAVELDPHNQRYIVAAEIARQHLVNLLVQEGEKARMMGHSDVERARLAEALTLDPHNDIAIQHVNELAAEALNPLEESTNGAAADVASPIELAPEPGQKTFHLRAGAAELLKQVVASYGLTAIIDETVQPQVRRLDAENVDYAHAAQMAEMVTGTFIVPLDPKRVLIARDTKPNRDKFERLAQETVYMPGLTATEITDVGNIARNIFDTPYATVLQTSGYMTVRAPVGRLRALNATLADLLGGRSQVELEIRAFEVATSRTRNIGLQLPQQTTFFNVDSEVNALIAQNQSLVNQIISSGLANSGDILKIAAILIASGQVSNSILSQPFALFGGGLTATGIVPGKIAGNLALNASDVRTLDDLSLRVLSDEAATFRTGVRYPIITSTVTSTTGGIPGINTAGISSTLAALGINPSVLGNLQQNTFPQVQYEDLGLTLKATPRIQQNKEVTLNLDLKIEALGGASLDNIPVLNNRQFTGVITVPDGHSVMLISNLTRQEARAVSGLPGLSELPGFGSATNKSTQFDVSKLIITVTTHVVRQSHGTSIGKMVILPLHE